MSITTSKIRKMKGKEKITMLTCYDYPTAKILDNSGVDMFLVGDSLSSVVLGFDNTTMVDMDIMVHHTAAVARGTKNALVVGDMPFLSYDISVGETLVNAGRLIKAGAVAVKLEGCKTQVITALTEAGIPVMSHLGLLPQSINQLGGYFIQGKTDAAVEKLLEEAKAVEKAGAFSVVLECVPGEVAKYITENIGIPTVGIGAGVNCDGQVLVFHDMAGYTDKKLASFVKQYADLTTVIGDAAAAYIKDVKECKFPDDSTTFTVPKN